MSRFKRYYLGVFLLMLSSVVSASRYDPKAIRVDFKKGVQRVGLYG